jgi:hypothetical protein
MPDSIETRLIEARRLRDAARGVLRSDIDNFRNGLNDRPIARRVRDEIVSKAADAMESGVDLASRNRLAIGLGLAGLAGWLFRKPLTGLGQGAWARLTALTRRLRA